MMANETLVVTKQCGDVLPFEFSNVRLTEVLHVPSLGFNLVSVRRLAERGSFRRIGPRFGRIAGRYGRRVPYDGHGALGHVCRS